MTLRQRRSVAHDREKERIQRALFTVFIEHKLRREQTYWSLPETLQRVGDSFNNSGEDLAAYLAVLLNGEFSGFTFAEEHAARHCVWTVLQLPAVLNMNARDRGVREWAKLFEPYTEGGAGFMFAVPSDFVKRAEFADIERLRAAGVTLEYAQAADPGPYTPYPVDSVIDGYLSGVPIEYIRALRG